MKHPIFVSAFATIYMFGTYLIYKELSVKNKFVALKFLTR